MFIIILISSMAQFGAVMAGRLFIQNLLSLPLMKLIIVRSSSVNIIPSNLNSIPVRNEGISPSNLSINPLKKNIKDCGN